MKPYFVLRWTVSSLVGWMAGRFLASNIRIGALSASRFYFILAVLTIVIIPVLIGFLQWRFALKGILKWRTWTLATIAISILFYAASIVMQTFSFSYIIVDSGFGSHFMFSVHDEGLMFFLLTPLVNTLCFAIPLWVVFRPRKHAAAWTIIGSFAAIIGAELSFFPLGLLLHFVHLGDEFLGFIASLYATGIFTVVLGMFLDGLLKNSPIERL